MKLKLLGALAGVAMLGAVASPAGAVTIYSDSVAGTNLWDYVFFSHSGGALDIDVLANSWTGGPTGTGIDDSFIVVFADNGSPIGALTGALAGINDDSFGFGDGSTSTFDSFFAFGALAAGNYVLAMGHCCAGEATARADGPSLIHAPDLDYQLTFSQNVGIGVPEPGTMALLGMGLLGLGWARTRRG